MASNLLKEVGYLYKNLSKMTIGQAILEDVDYDELTEEQLIYVVITPNDGLYKDARMKFLVSFYINMSFYIGIHLLLIKLLVLFNDIVTGKGRGGYFFLIKNHH